MSQMYRGEENTIGSSVTRTRI
eukprot:COSAG03_NODE_14788_length_452_cov_0.779037_1_plen_22_part_10